MAARMARDLVKRITHRLATWMFAFLEITGLPPVKGSRSPREGERL